MSLFTDWAESLELAAERRERVARMNIRAFIIRARIANDPVTRREAGWAAAILIGVAAVLLTMLIVGVVSR